MVLYEIIPTAMRGSGTFFKGRAGEVLGRAKLVYKGANGAWFLADADAVATMPTIGITLDTARVAGQIVRVLKVGYIGRADWTWTTGGIIYASTVAGELTQTPPAGIDDTIQQVGVASRTNMILFSPEGAGGGTGCAILEGVTMYVGFDECKAPFANYFFCDGVADNVQIQAAIDASTAGYEISLEAGTYDLGSTTITLGNHGKRLRGEEWHNTILEYSGTGSAVRVNVDVPGNVLNRINIGNLQIQATGGAIASATAIGLKATSVALLRLDNVYLKDFAAGTGLKILGHATSSSTWSLIDNIFTFNCKKAIVLEGVVGKNVNIVTIINPVLNGSAIGAGSIGCEFNQYTGYVVLISGDVSNFEVAFDIDGDHGYWLNTYTESISGTHFNLRANSGDNKIDHHEFTGGGTQVTDAGTDNRFFDCPDFVTENNVLSPAFAIDAVAVITVTIPHGLAVTPATEDCQLTVVEDTNVDDWEEGYVKVESVGAVNVVCKVNVTNASATGAATAKLALHVTTTL